MTPRAAAAAALAVAGLALGAAGCGKDSEGAADPATAPRTTPAVTTTATETTPQPTAKESADQRAERLTPPLAFHLRRRVMLRSSPGGKVLKVLKTKTVFKSPRILAVARRKPGWVGVRTEVLRGGKVGWIPSDAGVFFSEPRTLEIDLSRRLLTVRHRGKISARYRVAIGAPGTPTPQGFFAVTDRLKTGTNGSGPYGCCILALTGHQPKIAQGWGGGDRIAIHATPATWALGKAVSHGCVRASNKALRRLMAQVRLGTPVRIRA